MDKRDFYKGQILTQAHMDTVQALVDAAHKNFVKGKRFWGVWTGLDVSETSPESLNVEVEQGLGYDKDGERLYISSTQTVDMSGSVPGSDKRYASIFLGFSRSYSEPWVDEDGNSGYFQSNESFQISVVNGATHPTDPTPPALDASKILLADVLLTSSTTSIDDADIDTTRREMQMFDLLKTGQIAVVKNDDWTEPDSHEIEADFDTTITVVSSVGYGSDIMEMRDRYNRRIPGDAMVFVDEFCGSTLKDWWVETTNGVGEGVYVDQPMGAWAVRLPTLTSAPGDYARLTSKPYFRGEQRIGLVADLALTADGDSEKSSYFGISKGPSFDITDKGYGFYRKTGSVYARVHNGSTFTDVNTGLYSTAMSLPARFEIIPVMTDDYALVRVVFKINGAVVANISTTLPDLTSEAVKFFVNAYAETALTMVHSIVLDRVILIANRNYG